MNDGETAARQYDVMADDYSADNDEGVYNALYERPAMLTLLGDLAGRRVVDVGCGAGQLCAELVERGAVVSGIDVSEAMVELARERLGARVDLRVGDIVDPLPFADAAFDMAVASLVLHYLEDWTPTLVETRRVLEPGGTLLISTHHPAMDWQVHSPDDYFAKKQSTEIWTKRGRDFEVTTWRRPMSEISREVGAAGFVIEAIDEPMPSAPMADIDPTTDGYLRTHPHFLFLRLRPVSQLSAS